MGDLNAKPASAAPVQSDQSVFRIALAQTALAPGSIDASVAQLQHLAANARRGGADLLMLPEAFLCGYGSADSMRRLSISHDDPAFGQVLDTARRNGLTLLVGYAERAGPEIFNAAALISASGMLLSNYRKIHLWGDIERAAFSPGDASTVVELRPGLRSAVLICYDLEFPHVAQDLAEREVDLILVISATNAPYQVVPDHLVPARAYENSLFVAFCNHAAGVGDFVGLSRVAAPDGSFIAGACGSAPELVFADIDLPAFAAYRAHHQYRRDRRDLPSASPFPNAHGSASR